MSAPAPPAASVAAVEGSSLGNPGGLANVQSFGDTARAPPTDTKTLEVTPKRSERMRNARSLSPPSRVQKSQASVKVVTDDEVVGQVSFFIHIKGFLQDSKCEAEFRAFAQKLEFPADRVRLGFATAPRDIRWFAANGEKYVFSRRAFESGKWVGALEKMADDLNSYIATQIVPLCPTITPPTLSAVLVNRYRNGLDSISLHSDDEKCLGINPTIASLSLGVTRTMRVVRKQEFKFANHGGSSETKINTHTFDLADGDLFVFGGAAQTVWLHGIDKDETLEKQKKEAKAHQVEFVAPAAERLNFTFRPHLAEP